MTTEGSRRSLDFYARQGPITDPGEHAGCFEGLPTGIPALCQLLQGILLHLHWARRYGVELSEERRREADLRHVERMLSRIREMDDRDLTAARPLEKRLVGTCRDFSTLLCAILRHQGIPARARCGFGAYFTPGQYEDHWVCEYWNADKQHWVMVDAQLDDMQRSALQIAFDPCNVPHDQFLTGGKAWQMCRAGHAGPDRFGIFDMHGLWFIRGNLVRDMASLNKNELLPWDTWGIIESRDEDISDDDMALLDRVAALTVSDDSAFPEIRSAYESDARLRVSPVIKSYTTKGVQTVDLAGRGKYD